MLYLEVMCYPVTPVCTSYSQTMLSNESQGASTYA